MVQLVVDRRHPDEEEDALSLACSWNVLFYLHKLSAFVRIRLKTCPIMDAESDLRVALPNTDIGDDLGIAADVSSSGAAALADQTVAHPQRAVSFADEMNAVTTEHDVLDDRFDAHSWDFQNSFARSSLFLQARVVVD